MFHKIMGNLEKMQAIGDIISYFFPLCPNIILIVTLKRAQKSNQGKIYDIFSPCVFIFPLLDYAIIVLLSQTVYWEENMARGKSNHIFPAFFVIVSAYFNRGKIYDIFSPCAFIFLLCLYFSPRPCNNCSTFTGGVRREIFFPSVSMFFPCIYVFPLAMLYLPSQTDWI